jgi:hypothetical protein
MNKLWIYGCSYSNDGHFPRTDKGWFDYIADEWELEVINRSQAGTAWSYSKNLFYSDITHWNPNDMIIVESSHLQRMYSEFLQNRFEYFKYTPQTHCPIERNDENYLSTLLYITKDLDEIRRENWSQFVSSLLFLDKYIKNWFWWTFEFYPNSDELPPYIDSKFGDRLLKFENEIPTFNQWMRTNPQYCIEPPQDLHQTYECHKTQGYLFIDQIKGKGYDKGII